VEGASSTYEGAVFTYEDAVDSLRSSLESVKELVATVRDGGGQLSDHESVDRAKAAIAEAETAKRPRTSRPTHYSPDQSKLTATPKN
jgi:hypothetical protein